MLAGFERGDYRLFRQALDDIADQRQGLLTLAFTLPSAVADKAASPR